MYACVRAYSHSGLTEETCQLINQMSKQNTYKTVVYEFDANAGNWDDIKLVCHILFSLIDEYIVFLQIMFHIRNF